jgi:enoyl-CoA hydratase/carnithine racemase
MTTAADPSSDVVLFEVSDQVATITLDSPANRNALSRRLVEQLTGHLEDAAERADVRTIVLTHTGTTFCAGADMAEALSEGMEQGTRRLFALLRLLASVPKPVVAVVRGHVRAGGVGVVGACDVALVSQQCTFAFSESLLGLAPAIISLTTQTRMSERDAARKYLSGTTFDGAEAARSGLASQAVPAEALDAALVSTVAEFSKASPQGLRETKRLLNRGLLQSMDDEGEDLVALSARLFASEEAQEGMRAFRERRLPPWAQST